MSIAVERNRQIVEDVAESFWQAQARWRPELHTQIGLPIERLPTGGHEEALSKASSANELVGGCPDPESPELEGEDADTVGFLRHFAEAYRGEAEHFWAMPIGTPYQNLVTLTAYLDSVFAPFTFGARADVDRYVGLIADFGRRADCFAGILREQHRRRISIPRPALQGVIGSLQGLRSRVAEAFAVADSRLTALDFNSRSRLASRVAHLVDTEVVPAIDRMIAVVESPEYTAAAPEDLGMFRRPGGEAAYRFMVRRETTMHMTPEQLHRIGMEQCEELSERMRATRSGLGYDLSEADFQTVLRERAELYARSPQEVEERYLGYVARIEPQIGDYFSVLPRAPYGVARVREEAEAGMTFGYYEPPTPAAPVGRYRYNGSNLSERSLLTAAALIYHELVPGHHFHFARQAESAHLPKIRRYGAEMCGAFAEGWAEYASGLGWEMGLYDDPWDAYGRLAHERFTAARLVVDTALNLGWWNHERARAFMRANSTESETQLTSELLRYGTDLPAQALGYRAGFQDLTRMRADAETRSGDRFDIRGFHEAVLGGGGLPFTVLDVRVKRELTPI